MEKAAKIGMIIASAAKGGTKLLTNAPIVDPNRILGMSTIIIL